MRQQFVGGGLTLLELFAAQRPNRLFYLPSGLLGQAQGNLDPANFTHRDRQVTKARGQLHGFQKRNSPENRSVVEVDYQFWGGR